MVEEKITEKTVNVLAASLERLIGSIYAGFLSLAILLIEFHPIAESFTKSVGTTLAGMICVAIGFGLYSFYFKVLGEFFLFPAQHCMHILFDKLCNKQGADCTSPIGFLHSLGCSWLDVRSAYDRLRLDLYKGAEGREVQIAHGEIHALYITSVILVLAHIAIRYDGRAPSPLYLYISGVCLLSSLLIDTRQHILEQKAFRAQREEVVQFLKKHNYIDT